ncbi:hypothetical protein TTHERM_00237660 (macronuclear) [Tetrahymena thermophila SB210]|uniref:Uncharacterized protein n=1 Tax=Tetrahymena thermophila (strain SB210) TaxID=312017 RepID=I7LXF7_TETTS|nr:hypothetical protein TTHERM_00237660 [Tetrahymena thermophila SB210]EAS04551.2 hypothetical protein TTHERM_00237660 [Tetrahymena thermophila SB210]|eukprot:XP_001024796.2 hypothetical protein TTHERM_00237660 [Tetrahymena thermophila SB210]
MLGFSQMKSREMIAKQNRMINKNISQSNQVSLQTLAIPDRITQSVKSNTRPKQQDHKSFISKIFQNPSLQQQQQQQQDNINRQSRPNTITPNSSGLFSRKQKDSFNKTQYTPASSDSKFSKKFLNQSKEKITPFTTYTSNGSQQSQVYFSSETLPMKQKETHVSNFINQQNDTLSRRQSLIESQLQGVFEDSKNTRSQIKGQNSQEKQYLVKDISRKSHFALKKQSTPRGNRQNEEKQTFSTANDRFSSSEFMQFARKKSIVLGDQIHGIYKSQENSNLADTSNQGISLSPQKQQSIPPASKYLENSNLNQKQEQKAPIVHQITLLSHAPKIIASQSSQIFETRKSYLNVPATATNDPPKEIRSSEQIMKDFFPNLTTKARFPEQLNKKNEELIQQKKKRIEQYDQIFNELKNKRKTFSKFAFKSYEKQDNAQIRPVLEDLADGDPKGTMGVIDLWSDKNINKFLGNCKLIKDKLLISKIAAIKKKRGFFLDEKKPFLLSRKDELNLINKVYMSEQSKQFQEKYSKQLQRTMQNNSEINKNNLGVQQIASKKLSEQKCNGIGCTHKSCRQYLKQQTNQAGLSKKLIELSLDEEDQSNSSVCSSESQLSIQEVSQKKQNYNYNSFLRKSNIIKAPTNFGQMRTSILQQNSKQPQNNKNINLVNMLKLNNNMIRDLDYLQEQNDKDYMKLVETINCLQDKIVQQKVNDYEAQSSGNEY